MKTIFYTLSFLLWTGVMSVSVHAQLPANWANTDIGNAPAAGSAAYDAGTQVYTLTGSGVNAGTSDDGHFAYVQVQGDFILSAQILSLEGELGAEAKAGVSARASLDPDAPAIMCVYESTGSMKTLTRETAGGTPTVDMGATVSLPYYARIFRSQGETFVTNDSQNGGGWTNEVSKSLPQMPDTMWVGIYLSPNNQGSATATYGTVMVTGNVLATIGNINLSRELSIHPNPAGNQLFVSFDQPQVEAVEVFDLTGKKQLSFPAQKLTTGLDISPLAAGMYVFQVRTAEGVANQKFVKQ